MKEPAYSGVEFSKIKKAIFIRYAGYDKGGIYYYNTPNHATYEIEIIMMSTTIRILYQQGVQIPAVWSVPSGDSPEQKRQGLPPACSCFSKDSW